MKILVVTEKCNPIRTQRDGGARLVETMQRSFGDTLSILQFGKCEDSSATWQFEYPVNHKNRFERRIANADFIGEKIQTLEQAFTHVIFIHLSMQFGLIHFPLKREIIIWTFPMLLTPSYLASGETVPARYTEMERLALVHSQHIITPSHFERRQLVDFYSVPQELIRVIPRGVDSQWIVPKIRRLESPPKFCAVGSIKPQKETIGLIRLFAKIRKIFPEATLKMIGPIQNSDYYRDVLEEIKRRGLDEAIEFAGYVPPPELPAALEEAHLHLSTSLCETFGRSIFETLASGLPNVARAAGNAAAEFLQDLPYARFTDNEPAALHAIQEIFANLPTLSEMACEIGELYNDARLSQLLVAEICRKECMGVCDFDGTLFHKDDPDRTRRCMEAFQSYPIKVLCSARPIDQLMEKMRDYQIEVDWIIGCSGSVVANGKGEILWHRCLDSTHIEELKRVIPDAQPIEVNGKVLQIAVPKNSCPNIFGLRIEIYQEMAFIGHWEASKLHAVHRLLSRINWLGRVSVFGDGPYDAQLVKFFDGILLSNNLKNELRYA
jgi:glycosyltransferase involved in cell wall biosynthesis